MNNNSEREILNAADVFGVKDLILLVGKKLTSQALLFSLVFVVILVASLLLLPSELRILMTISLLFIYVVGTLSYLFFEQRQKLQKGDGAALSGVLGDKLKSIKNSSSNFSVEVWTTQIDESRGIPRDIVVRPRSQSGKYRIGERINVHLRSNRDCYVTLLNIGTSGKLTVLFPNDLHWDNFIRADQVHEIPGNEYGFEYRIEGPTGTEKLKAIATLQKVDLLESQFASDGSMFRTVSQTAAARDIGVVGRRVEQIDSADWAESAWEFDVVS